MATLALKFLYKPFVMNNFSRCLSSSSKLVGLEINDQNGIATVSLQRPPVNSLNLDLLSDFLTTLTELESNKCRGAILTSSYSTVFSAGLDIMEMYKPDPNRAKKFWLTLQDVFIKLYGSPYPTVAVINGHSPAGGCLLATSCEYRVMQKGFTIGLNESQLGMIAPKWFMMAMKNVIGIRQTEMALTLGRLFNTDEAHKLGLVDEVVINKQEGIERATSFLSQFSKISPIARALSKQMFREEDLKVMIRNRETDLNLFITAVTNEDLQKRLGIYLESLKKKQASA
ncbi:enoyl-CoA delta isomerase 1, mitochondrial-like [Cylas formicarius]|uniref:enoyl-CoA delta isomerase 1, mitochondrial-like n=1 Tax=Cylas formicarius TaxID=197179 RepID=UPI002958D137|nr:enoyl-CoA delta isomerase 1, mitochondrial-like [Cylas formicarius]